MNRCRPRTGAPGVLVAIVLTVLLAAACSSTVGGAGGVGSRPPGTGPAGSGSGGTGPVVPSFPTSAPPATGGPVIPSYSLSPPPSTTDFCGSSLAPSVVTNCLRTVLSQFWSGQLNEQVEEPVFVDPRPAQVPGDCRAGLSAAPAFTCRSDLSLYITDRLLRIIRTLGSGEAQVYAFAAVQAHEIGHVLQYRLHQPQLAQAATGDLAASRFVEQQADCLAGVWAAHATSENRAFDPSRFVEVESALLRAVSTTAEIRTHGTPTQRGLAVGRGLQSGRPQACKLVTFR